MLKVIQDGAKKGRSTAGGGGLQHVAISDNYLLQIFTKTKHFSISADDIYSTTGPLIILVFV